MYIRYRDAFYARGSTEMFRSSSREGFYNATHAIIVNPRYKQNGQLWNSMNGPMASALNELNVVILTI